MAHHSPAGPTDAGAALLGAEPHTHGHRPLLPPGLVLHTPAPGASMRGEGGPEARPPPLAVTDDDDAAAGLGATAVDADALEREVAETVGVGWGLSLGEEK